MRGKKHEDYQIRYISKGGKGFFRIYKDLFYDPKFKSLTPAAKMVFVAMGIASNGQRTFTFPYSAYKELMSKDGFLRAKEQLKKAGFLGEEHYRTVPNIYYFSDEWKR